MTISNEAFFELVRHRYEATEKKKKSTTYYENNYAEYKDHKLFISWNWSAALLLEFWLFYRKMYAYFFAIVGIQFLLGFLAHYLYAKGYSTLDPKGGWYILTLVFLHVGVLGLFGNAIYFHFLRQKYAANIHRLGTNNKFLTVLIIAILYFVYSDGIDALVKILVAQQNIPLEA